MQIKKDLIIKNKVFDKQQFINLIGSFYDEFNIEKKLKGHTVLETLITCSDGSIYKYDMHDGDIMIRIDELLTIKNISSVKSSYYKSVSNKYMELGLNEGTPYYQK